MTNHYFVKNVKSTLHLLPVTLTLNLQLNMISNNQKRNQLTSLNILIKYLCQKKNGYNFSFTSLCNAFNKVEKAC